MSQTELAAQTVEELVRRYFAVTDELGQDPAQPLRRLRTVVSSTQLLGETNLLEGQRAAKQRQVGDVRLLEVTVDSLSLDGTPTAYVHVCWDVTDVDIIDDSGKSVISAKRADRGWTNYTVTNTHWDSKPSAGWRISGGADMEKEPCVG